jgi:hypothetical protein
MIQPSAIVAEAQIETAAVTVSAADVSNTPNIHSKADA